MKLVEQLEELIKDAMEFHQVYCKYMCKKFSKDMGKPGLHTMRCERAMIAYKFSAFHRTKGQGKS